MMDSDTKARRCMKRKLAHRAAQLRKRTAAIEREVRAFMEDRAKDDGRRGL